MSFIEFAESLKYKGESLKLTMAQRFFEDPGLNVIHRRGGGTNGLVLRALHDLLFDYGRDLVYFSPEYAELEHPWTFFMDLLQENPLLKLSIDQMTERPHRVSTKNNSSLRFVHTGSPSCGKTFDGFYIDSVGFQHWDILTPMLWSAEKDKIYGVGTRSARKHADKFKQVRSLSILDNPEWGKEKIDMLYKQYTARDWAEEYQVD